MASRQERSAGVVVFRTDPTAPGGRLYLLLDYGRHWDLPKGHVERGEDDRTAALRELREETAVDDATLLAGFQHELSYFFRDKRKGLIHKTVVFFLGRTSASNVTLSHEHVGSAFLPYEQALKTLTYANAKALLTAAETFLREHPEHTSDSPPASD